MKQRPKMLHMLGAMAAQLLARPSSRMEMLKVFASTPRPWESRGPNFKPGRAGVPAAKRAAQKRKNRMMAKAHGCTT